MPSITPDSESWKKMVLRSMPPPAWLSEDAPEGDVVISTRVRYARNLKGFRFPHHAPPEELRSVQRLVSEAVKRSKLDFEVLKRVTEAERDYLIGCRLLSPEFPGRETGRMLLLDTHRSVSVMVNVEDHLRIQSLTAGWSLENAHRLAEYVLGELSRKLAFAESDAWGNLTASVYNVGSARRLSVMFHLIGLAHTKKLNSVLRALAARSLVARGLFGESSRAVGAFFQVSSTTGDLPEFQGASEYLLKEERLARREVQRASLTERAESAIEFAITSSEISLADALRVLAWVRWAASVSLPGFPSNHREVDGWISALEVRGTTDVKAANRERATFLRARLEG